jgi:hypothetical protein
MAVRLDERPGNPAITPEGRVILSLHPFPCGEASPHRVVEVLNDGSTAPVPGVRTSCTTRRQTTFIEHFRSYYGPIYKAFASLDAAGREALENDLKELMDHWNVSGDGTVVLPSDYLEVVAVRR